MRVGVGSLGLGPPGEDVIGVGGSDAYVNGGLSGGGRMGNGSACDRADEESSMWSKSPRSDLLS